jgi:F-type H+-transporting ATPase subunit gamma
MMKNFTQQKFDVIELVYAKFKNAASQDFTVERFLPVAPSKSTKKPQPRPIIFLNQTKKLCLKSWFLKF